MKRIFFAITAVFAMTLFSCTDCANNGIKTDKFADSVKNVNDSGKKENMDELTSDSLSGYENINVNNNDNIISEHQEVQKVETSKEFKLDDKGVGNIKVGMNIEQIMKKQPGLYDKTKVTKMDKDNNLYLFYNKNVQVLEVLFSKKDKIVKSIRVTASSILTKDGIYQGMNLKTIKKDKELRKVIEGKDIDNTDFININGIRYEFEENIKGDKFVSAIILQ